MTVTSSNPHVTFPFGNVVKFPPLQKQGQSTGNIRVALNGESGIETTDFDIPIVAPELELPSGLNVTATHRLNFNEAPGGTTTESVESGNHGWTVTGSPVALPNVAAWQRRALSAVRHVWWGPDNNGQIDGIKSSAPDEQILMSPLLQVGTAPLTIAFQHRFAFEAGNWDGGVIEISSDNGATWADIGTPAYNGRRAQRRLARLHRRRLERRGTGCANQQVRIRFRVGADESAGAPSCDIDDIAIGGLANTPFTALVPNIGVCTTEQQH